MPDFQGQCQTAISAKRLWETLFALKVPFCCFVAFKKVKWSFSFSTPSMQYCAAVWGTCRRQNHTPTLNGAESGGGGGWMLIVLFSEATPFEDNVSTILSWIVISALIKDCYQQRPKAEAVNTYRALDYSRYQKILLPCIQYFHSIINFVVIFVWS